MSEKNIHMMTGTLVLDEARNCLLLDGHELSHGENIEICVFGSWIPGQVALDGAGWSLTTLDQVGIRLHSGLPARASHFHVAAAENIALQPVQQASHPHILIVDDDPALLQALPRTIALRLPDVHVEVANSALIALSLIQGKRYDAIVSDIKMPEMDGFALLAKIQELQPETPTLLITGHGEHNLAIQALRGGAYDYIQKPIERDNFVAALLRAIQTCQLRRQVSEQKHALEVYARSLEKLVQQRTEELAEAHIAKDKVMRLVTHEMHEPLDRLKEIMHILRQKLGNGSVSEIVTRSFSDIEASIARTEELTQELVDTSHLETHTLILHREHYNLIELCHKVLTEEAQHSGMALSFENVSDPVYVNVDPLQIQQVLHTLVSHVYHMGEHDVPVTVTIQSSAREAVIAIRDRCEQTSLGAGFFIARKTVERHGGHLEVQHFPQERRTMFVTLPTIIDPAKEEFSTATAVPSTHAVWTIKVSDQKTASI